MKTYKLTERCFVGTSLYGPGEVAGDTVTVADDVKPGKAWVLVESDDADEKAAAKAAKAAEKAAKAEAEKAAKAEAEKADAQLA